NPSPLQSSRLSLEYLLLPPRSALGAAPVRLTPIPSQLYLHPHARLLGDLSLVLTGRRGSIGSTLKRHPFSGLVHSAGELLH
ncbi:hypothetical protein COEREDRAFT_20021, partial [Coemansia reversa NRRL 1564]